MPRIDAQRPWRKWYATKRWHSRTRHQLYQHPLCVMCLDKGYIVAARVVDHVIAHKGNANLFWFGELQSLCASCHNSTKKQIEDKGYACDIGHDGWPVDHEHPVYLKR